MGYNHIGVRICREPPYRRIPEYIINTFAAAHWESNGIFGAPARPPPARPPARPCRRVVDGCVVVYIYIYLHMESPPYT